MKTFENYKIHPRADLGGASLGGANLRGANLRRANLSYAVLRGANLRYADLRGANLSGANLSGANLREANLSGANLRDADVSGVSIKGTIGDGKVLRTMRTPEYVVVVCGDWVQIGCEGHRAHEWSEFTDEEIYKMDSDRAVVWWHRNKDAVFSFLDADGQE